jgi:hypothetical protein
MGQVQFQRLQWAGIWERVECIALEIETSLATSFAPLDLHKPGKCRPIWLTSNFNSEKVYGKISLMYRESAQNGESKKTKGTIPKLFYLS